MVIQISAYAQKEINVKPVTKKMSRGEQPGFYVMIPEGKLKEVKSAYKKQLQLNTKAGAKEIEGEIINYGVVNKNFSVKPFIVYSKFLETNEGIDMTVFVSEDSLTFLSETSDVDKVTALKKSLRDFAVNEYKKNVARNLEAENAELKEIKKQLENNMKDENQNIETIGKNQREIENYESKMEANKAAQTSKTEQINNQQSTVSAIKDKKSIDYEQESKTLKNYKSDLKDLENSLDKLGKTVDKNKTEIRELEQKNETLKKQQTDFNTKIEAQEQVVKTIEKELNEIK